MFTIHTQTKTTFRRLLEALGFRIGPPLTKNGFTQEEEAEILRRMNSPESDFLPIEELFKKFDIEKK